MTAVLELLLAHPWESFFLILASGWAGSSVFEAMYAPYVRRLEHRERMAALRARTETARALHAAPEEAQRSELAKQLLAAYEEAGEELRNDEKGSLVRWELTRPTETADD